MNQIIRDFIQFIHKIVVYYTVYLYIQSILTINICI